MKKLLAPIAVAALLQPIDAQAQLFDTLCNLPARLWIFHSSGILDFELNGSSATLVDTLMPAPSLISLAYTGVFGLPTFAGGVFQQGTHVWDGVAWSQWPGLNPFCSYHGAGQSVLYYWVNSTDNLWVFDGVAEQAIWTLPAGYALFATDIAVDSVGNAYLALNNGGAHEIRCISPQGMELATWNVTLPAYVNGLAMVGDMLYYTYASNIATIQLGVPPNATAGPVTVWGFGVLNDMANCPTADFTLTDMARSTQREGGMGIYPNPAQDQFQVVLPAAFDNSAANITIHDAQGRLVWTGSSSRAKFMIDAALEPGNYVVVANNSMVTVAARLVVL